MKKKVIKRLLKIHKETLDELHERLEKVEQLSNPPMIEPIPETQKDFIIKELHKELDKKDHNLEEYKKYVREVEDISIKKSGENQELKNKLANIEKILREAQYIYD